jgi:hypothetical protein
MEDQSANTINFEINSTNFPKECTIKMKINLKFFAIDAKKMSLEGRNVPSKKDYLLEQTSISSYDWSISYNEHGIPKIEGSSQSVVFNFPKPMSTLSNTMTYVKVEGQVTLFNNGKIDTLVPIGYTRQYKNDVSYVLHLEYNETKNNKILFGFSFLTNEELRPRLENKPTTNKFSGAIVIPATKK